MRSGIFDLSAIGLELARDDRFLGKMGCRLLLRSSFVWHHLVLIGCSPVEASEVNDGAGSTSRQPKGGRFD
ncbi:hypothetical protein PanWU01x14_050700 [Parasponia andersonii]|uniref:Uncharacterized protein n=1 Tax=Parasponia andersonii TaxID=3476 RepID=A0A2P5DLT3_PARAD|nr:hypothetical protein PanWU01x14_050700 [Parasponia andersonii]